MEHIADISALLLRYDRSTANGLLTAKPAGLHFTGVDSGAKVV